MRTDDLASPDTLPELSTILLTADSYAQIRKTVRALAKQTVRDKVELIIVCPSEDRLGLVLEEVKEFHSVRILSVGEMKATSDFRAAAVRVATAPIVGLSEDHAYPEPGWAEAMIEAHKGPWAGVGPAFLNANPGLVSWVALVLGYGRWVEPVQGGPAEDIPGHNSCWKRALLMEYGPRLEEMLPALTLMHFDLRARGHQLYLEPAAKVPHLQVSSLWPCMAEHFHGARMFPAGRALHWPWYRRLFYVCGMPLILARHFRGWAGHLLRIDPKGGLLARAWPILLVIGTAWGLGEVAGYAFGIGKAEEGMLAFETDRVPFCNRRDRELLATY